MLKTIKSSHKLASSRINSSKLASSRNDDNRSVFGKNDGNGKVDGFGISGNDIEYAKKSGKLKDKKSSKSQKSAKSRKNLSKSGSLPNFGAMDAGPSFLTPEARATFNCLQLAFTEASIL